MNENEIRELREKTREMLQAKFGNIVFEEIPHRYTIDGVEYTPVSTIISKYEQPFDEDRISKAYANKHGKTQEEVLTEWKWINRCSTVMGTRAHEFGESYTNFKSGHKELICEQNKPQFLEEENWLVPTFPQEFAIKAFYDNLNKDLHPIGAEFKLSTQYIDGAKPICGTADILFYYDAPNPKNSGYVIGDWKGLDIKTPILTTNGWKTMGTVKIGDTVYDINGKPTKVLHASEIHHRKCYKITFDNNEDIICDNEHRWLITTQNGEGFYCDKVMTSDEIYQSFNSIKLMIRNPKPIEYDKNIYNVSSYYVGNTIAKKNIVERVLNIPNDFLYSTIDNRIDLLRGIINVIGRFEEKKFKIIWLGDSLSEDIIILLSSLGIKTELKKEIGGNTISFVTDNKKILKEFGVDYFAMNQERQFRTIVNIEEVETVPTRCIEVDSQSHTFLCGKNFLVTHNTNRELTKDFIRSNNIMMLPPFDNMYDESLSHYYLQFNLYQRMMESVGLNIIARRLIHIKRDGTYEVHAVPKMDDSIIDQVIKQ